MSVSKITGNAIAWSAACSSYMYQRRKQQSSVSLTLNEGSHVWIPSQRISNAGIFPTAWHNHARFQAKYTNDKIISHKNATHIEFGFPLQTARSAGIVSISWRNHAWFQAKYTNNGIISHTNAAHIEWILTGRYHFNDVIMTTVASQITSLTVVYSIVYSSADQKTIKVPRYWPLCGEFIGTGEFPSQRASNAENGPIWWRHQDIYKHFAYITYHQIWTRLFRAFCGCIISF